MTDAWRRKAESVICSWTSCASLSSSGYRRGRFKIVMERFPFSRKHIENIQR